jgi:phage gp46-like protein
MTTDVALNRDKGYWDFEWTSTGDISTIQSFDTAILMSILEEVRASASEVAESRARRGWIGNESTPGFEQGSKTWLFDQERVTGTILAELGVVVRNGLQWFIDANIIPNVEVEQPFIQNGKVVTFINFRRDGSRVERQFFEIWDNTGDFT